MHKLTLFALVLAALSSCVKHEEVPAPVNIVKLVPHFTGTINGTDVEFTDDVDGFNGFDSQDQNILAPPSLSSAKYYCDMNSDITNSSIKIGIGSCFWDASALDKPSVSQFNSFFTGLLSKSVYFSDNAVDGFVVSYRDVFGNTWLSKEYSVNSQSVTFNTVELESDDTGDYALCDVSFSCHVYRTVGLDLDSLRIDNGSFKCWFKR